MIHTAQVSDNSVEVTLVSIDGENFFVVPFYPEAGNEEEIASYISPMSEQDAPYTGFSRAFLKEKGAKFGTL